jgi:hypothetical protein
MRHLKLMFWIAAFALAAAAPLMAHHSFAAEYDASKPAKLPEQPDAPGLVSLIHENR